MGKRILNLAAAVVLAVSLVGCGKTPVPPQSTTSTAPPEGGAQSVVGVETPALPQIDRMGVYDTREDVSLYLVTYGVLPDNYITKDEAKRHGWEGGNVEAVMGDGFCIGGDRFGNFEGNLPEGEAYIECDIDTIGYKSRGSRRLVYTEDISAIYYTHDHYDTFETVYIDGEFVD